MLANRECDFPLIGRYRRRANDLCCRCTPQFCSGSAFQTASDRLSLDPVADT